MGEHADDVADEEPLVDETGVDPEAKNLDTAEPEELGLSEEAMEDENITKINGEH